jgi:hypothetical protein
MVPSLLISKSALSAQFMTSWALACHRAQGADRVVEQAQLGAGWTRWHAATIVAGRADMVSCIVAPGCPLGRPGFRPGFGRRDLGEGFAMPSGGFEEFSAGYA